MVGGDCDFLQTAKHRQHDQKHHVRDAKIVRARQLAVGGLCVVIDDANRLA